MRVIPWESCFGPHLGPATSSDCFHLLPIQPHQQPRKFEIKNNYKKKKQQQQQNTKEHPPNRTIFRRQIQSLFGH